ncbi:unnamed protein product [Paramecium sonneborni]|uniref:Uncharacterized protein n=1 Tax=Paramecium sonneborni TaxID=65129 RepID=A0A8S1PRJ1_9CILI|nr:unnamed protein product [Paramecium sonneborni]
MSFSTSSVSNSAIFSQSSLNSIQTQYDEELEQQELEAEKEKFAQMFEAHYNTTNMFIQTVQESVILKKANKQRMLKRKIRKLMRSSISSRKMVEILRKEESVNEMTQQNLFKYYPYYEGQYYGVDGNINQEIDNQDWQPKPVPIIKPNSSSIFSSLTLHSESQTNISNISNINDLNNNDINLNQMNNNIQINNTNNNCEGIVRKAFQQYDPNEQCYREQHQQQ